MKNSSGSLSESPLCGQKTKKGKPCRNPVARGKKRCYLHGFLKSKVLGDVKKRVPSDNKEAVAVIGQLKNNDKGALINDMLQQADFFTHIELQRKSLGLSKADYAIVIKPDLEIFGENISTGTDPEIVEAIISLLFKKGYSQVSVVDGLGQADLWLENRDVLALADLIGYRFETDDNNPYDIVNLSEDCVNYPFPQGAALYGSTIGRAWSEANFRIIISKNKTDEENYFSLSMQNLLGILPKRDKSYHYHSRRDAADVAVDLMRYLSPHFSIIDALISNHGVFGSNCTNPLPTNTIIAGENLLLVDWLGALKMGLDPYASSLNEKGLETFGLPKRYKVIGDLSTYKGWKNVTPLLADSVRRRNKSPFIERMVKPWLQSVSTDLFPFKNAVDEKINRFVSTALKREDENQMLLVGINNLLASCHRFMESYQIMLDKENYPRYETSLGIDLGKYEQSYYESIIDYIEPLGKLVSQTPKDRNGIRWRYIDGSVLFESSRSLPYDFKDFILRVDISHAVRMMNDNTGGACVPVSHDSKGRITRQAERNIYLPQPNWMTFFGGNCIDVGKLEYMVYEKDRHQIFWRTVNSLNNSATFDDGIVTFKRDDKGKTNIQIVTRQQFSLPLFWQVINIDLFPQIKDVLVSNAYLTYFSQTMANYEAAYEGRTVLGGRPFDPDYGEAGSIGEKMPPEEIIDCVLNLGEIIGPFIKNFQAGQNISNRWAKTFVSDLLTAIKKDMIFMPDSLFNLLRKNR